MDLILRLLDHVLFYLLQEWLYVHEIAKLDSAVCSSQLREKFLHSLMDSTCPISLDFCVMDLNGYLAWILKRKVSVTALVLGNDHTITPSARYIQRNPHINHVTTIHLYLQSQMPDKWLEALFKTCVEVSDLVLSLHRSYNHSKLFSLISKYCFNLKTLHFHEISQGQQYYQQEEIVNMRDIVHHCPLMESFTADHLLVTPQDFTEICRTWKFFRVLDVDVSGAVSVEHISTLIKNNCSSLQHLRVPHTLEGLTLCPDIAPCLSRIQVLKIHYENNCDCANSMLLLSSCPLLRQLEMGVFEWTDAVLGALLMHPTLENVVLILNTAATGETMLFPSTASVSALRSLTLSMFHSITDTGLYILLQRCPELTQLCLRSCHELTITGIVSALTFCPLLQSLMVGGPFVDRAGLALAVQVRVPALNLTVLP